VNQVETSDLTGYQAYYYSLCIITGFIGVRRIVNQLKNDLEKPKDYYEPALEIGKEQLGANHDDVAVSYIRLGNAYYNKDHLEKAKDYYEPALEIRKEQLGANHVDVAVSYIRLGNVYYNKDDLEKAKDYYEPALEIGKEQLGANHVMLLSLTSALVTRIITKMTWRKQRITMNQHWKLEKNN
jgi:tetratricopeptide (TPR) repeat protein